MNIKQLNWINTFSYLSSHIYFKEFFIYYARETTWWVQFSYVFFNKSTANYMVVYWCSFLIVSSHFCTKLLKPDLSLNNKSAYMCLLKQFKGFTYSRHEMNCFSIRLSHFISVFRISDFCFSSSIFLDVIVLEFHLRWSRISS